MTVTIQRASDSRLRSFNWGLSLLGECRYGAALTVFRLCLDRAEKMNSEQLAEIHDRIGFCLDHLGMPVEASEHFDRARTLHEDGISKRDAHYEHRSGRVP